MVSCKSIYEPQEDSTLLERYVRQYAKGRVIDIGTGSGIQAIAAAQNTNVSSVLATDIEEEVIKYCNKNIKNKKIKFFQSDLFRNIKRKFDTIIFNPPYLPHEMKLKDLAIESGKKGYETIEKFLNEANNFLKSEGIILIVFSSLTKKEKVEEFIKNNLLEFQELEKTHIFFEDIYVYKLRKSHLLKILEIKGLNRLRYFATGHRGILFRGIMNDNEVVVKTKNPESKAINRIENEIGWLKKLNKNDIGPKLLIAHKDFFIYKYIEGKFIADCIKESNKNEIKNILKKIFNQMFILDKLKIDKEEMHHPLKHIIISENKPYLIDFERAHYSHNPKNVTQFCQFIINSQAAGILKQKKMNIQRDKIIELAKIYKNHQNRTNFEKIIKIL